MIKTNIINILAGIGAVSILLISFSVALNPNDAQQALTLGGLTGAPAQKSVPKGKVATTPKAKSGLECPFDNFDVYSSYSITTHSPIKQGSSIFIDNKGNIFNIFTGNSNVEKFRKEDGGGFSEFTSAGAYKEQFSELVGMYVDETNGVVYVPGTNFLLKLFRYDLSGKPLTPASWDSTSGFLSVDGYGDKIFALPSAKIGNKYILKKYNFDGTVARQVNLPYDVAVYPDMAVGPDGIVYIPMNLVAGIQYKDNKGNAYYTYKYISAILRFDVDLNPLPDLFHYETSERSQNNFTEEEKVPHFSRLAIAKDGNLTFLMKNINDKDTNGYARQNLFRQYDKDGKLLREWSTPGLHFYDLDADSDGNVFAVTASKVYKYALKCGEIIIEKNTSPKPRTKKEFEFTKDFIDSLNFKLADDSTGTSKNKETFNIWGPFDAGKVFNVSELEDKNYDTTVSCADSSLETKTGVRLAQIKVNKTNAGKVSCIFYNTQKKYVPADTPRVDFSQ